MSVVRRTPEENERLMYLYGWPEGAAAFAAAHDLEILTADWVDWPSLGLETGAQASDEILRLRALSEDFRSALQTVALLRPEWSPVVEKFLEAPEHHDFDRLCDELPDVVDGIVPPRVNR